MRVSLYLLLFLLFCVGGAASPQVPKQESSFSVIESYLKNGEFEKAEMAAQRAINNSQLSDNQPLYYLLYQSLRGQRAWQKAIEVAELLYRNCTNKNTEACQETVVNLTVAEAYINARKWKEAKPYLEFVQSIITLTALQPLEQARFLFVQGSYILGANSDRDGGVTLLQETLSIINQSGEPATNLRGEIYRHLGNLSRWEGDFPQALWYYKQGLEGYKKAYRPNHSNIAYAHYNLGGVLYEMMDFETALHEFLQCYDVWKDHSPLDERYFRFLTEAIGDMYWKLNDRANALKFYDIAISGEQMLNRDSSILLNQIADTLLLFGNTEQALGYYQESMDFRIRNYGLHHPMTAACQNFVARALNMKGEKIAALSAYQYTLEILYPSFKPQSNQENPPLESLNTSIQYALEAMAGKGSILLEEALNSQDFNLLTYAANTLLLGVDLLEQIRRSPQSESAKLLWTARGIELIENTIQAELALYRHSRKSEHLEKAFQLAEMSKNFLFAAKFQSEQLREVAGVPAKLLTEEAILRQEILTYEGKIQGEERRCAEAREKHLSLWREKLQELRLSHSQLQQVFKRDHPRYFELKYGSQGVHLPDLQADLAFNNGVIISFFSGQDAIYSFYIDKNRIQAFEVERTVAFDSILLQFQSLIKQQETFIWEPQKAFRSYTGAAHFLYKELLAAPLALCPTGTERILINSSRELANLPFSCLLTAEVVDTPRDYRNLPYLIRDYAVSSIVTLNLLRQPNISKERSPRLNYAGFAPDYSQESYDHFQLTALPNAKNEVHEAKRLIGGKAFLGDGATESAWRSTQAGILHFAGHTQIEAQNPMLSGLLLSDSNNKGDGILHAYELYGLQYNAQLAILSSCYSAAGPDRIGEGTQSIERALYYTGIPAILSASWAVEDMATGILVQSFLKKISKGEDKDQALRKAQLQYLADAAPNALPPFYWAGLRLSGNTSPIRFLNRPNFVFWLVGTAILLISLFYIIKAGGNRVVGN